MTAELEEHHVEASVLTCCRLGLHETWVNGQVVVVACRLQILSDMAGMTYVREWKDGSAKAPDK